MAIPILLRHLICPGDTTVMTVVPRELYRQYPGQFEVSVQTAHPDIWIGNPFVTNVFTERDEAPPHYRVVNLSYSPRHERLGMHFMHSYLASAAEQLRDLGVDQLPLTEFRPCLKLTSEEAAYGPNPAGIFQGHPYWLVMVGGKYDISTKWWDPKAWQQVVYSLASDASFPMVAQVGKSGKGAWHSMMGGAVNLLDKTSLRELIWLTYWSRGVICGVTSLMHIAAAFRKPCVVVAGGREAWWWDSYDERAFMKHSSTIPEQYHKLFPLRPRHIYLDTIGRLPCCQDGGCWRVGIGENPKNNCVDIIKPVKYSTKQSIPQPRCMTLIKPDDVLKAVYMLERGQ